VVGLLLIGLALIVGIATVPAVQQAWLRRQLLRAGAHDIDLAGLQVTPTGLTAHRIAFERGPLALQVDAPLVRLRLWPLLAHHRLEFAQVSTAGIAASWDLAAPARAEPAGPAGLAPAPAEFAGLLASLRPPLPVALQSLDLLGSFTLRRGAAILGVWQWSLRGGSRATDQTATFAWQATAENGHDAALGWGTEGVLRLVPAATGLDRVELTGGAAPAAGALPAVTFSARLATTATGESYQAKLEAGPATVVTVTGDFDRKTGRVSGQATAASSPTALGPVLGRPLPPGSFSASASLTADTRAHATHLTFLARGATAPLGAWLPALAGLDSAALDVTGTLDGSAGTWTVATGHATVTAGRPALPVIQVALLRPWTVSPPVPAAAPLAEIRLAHLPLAWANPALASGGLTLGAGEINGAWNVLSPVPAAGAAPALVVAPSEPLVAGPLQLRGGALPALPPLTLRGQARLEWSAGAAHLTLPDLRLESARGDLVQFRTDTTWAPGDLRTRGAIDATLPTLLGGTDQPVPFILTAHWSAEQRGPHLRLEALQAAVRSAPRQPTLLELNLARPVELDLADPGAGLADANADLARLQAHGLPLGWLSRWLPGRELAGTWAEGESRVRFLPGHGFTLETTQPWRLTGIRFAEGGHEFFRGAIQLSPSLAYGPKERWLRVTGFDLRDDRGPWLTGRFGVALRGADDTLGGGIALTGEIPEPGRWHGTFGLLSVAISASAHLDPGAAADLRRLSVTVTHAHGAPLLSLTAAEPLHLERTPQAEWLARSEAPLRLVTGRLPLAWLNPLLVSRATVVDGVLPPTELQLELAPRHLRLSAVAPVAVAGFRLARGGELLVDQGLLRFTPALQVELTHSLLPVFHVRYEVAAGLTFGYVAAANTRLALFDGEIQAGGDETGNSTGRASGNLWVDLGALGRLPLLAAERLPGRGELRVTVTNDETKTQAVDFRINVDRLAGRDGKPAAALEVRGHAHLKPGERVGGFTVDAVLQSAPHPSDLHFGALIDRQDLSVMGFASKLESNHLDFSAVRAFAGAFSPAQGAAAAPRPAAPAGAAPAVPPPRTAPVAAGPRPGPPWGPWRGRFTLAVRQLTLDGNEIDNLSGQLEITDRAFILHNLSGAMFDGRWSADFKTDFQPGAPGGDNELTAHFRIAAFDAGRVVRHTFPQEIARIDGRLDLDVSLSGRATRFEDLVPQATGTFALSAHHGTLRLTLPKQEMISSGLILGGALTFSPEMKALGRVVSRLQSMPFDELSASGRLEADGALHLEDFRLDSPDLRMVATGQLADAKTGDLMKQALQMQASLYAKNDLAVILGGMKLLNAPGADGYQPLRQPFAVAGTVGQPDLHPLYDFLAQGVAGAKGTWAVLMRKVQAEVEKRRAAPAPAQVNK
jgi:hypothetical protein